jgi:hypothetical protein
LHVNCEQTEQTVGVFALVGSLGMLCILPEREWSDTCSQEKWKMKGGKFFISSLMYTVIYTCFKAPNKGGKLQFPGEKEKVLKFVLQEEEDYAQHNREDSFVVN